MTAITHDVPAPGTFIREELEARNWAQRDLAYVLGVPEQAVNMIISGKRGISADMARALGEAFGVSAELFANLQKMYDLRKARDPDPNIAKKARLQQTYPVREMIKRGWIVDADTALIEVQMAKFFCVDSPEWIPHIEMDHAAKKTDYDEIPAAQLAWLFRVRQIAQRQAVGEYSEHALRGALSDLRSLLREPRDVSRVPRIMSECGVRFIVVEGLPGGKIDGVTFWLDANSPVIGMSLRFDRIDNFWFVFRHEIEHVLRRHGGGRFVVDADLQMDTLGTGTDVPAEELDANRAAADFCVPKAKMDSFVARKSPFFSKADVLAFASLMGVHPGLVVGQLRHRTGRHELFSKLLAGVRSEVVATAVVDGWGETYPA
jgi:HTH-type transcriptional regulator / antitoxin HigA